MADAKPCGEGRLEPAGTARRVRCAAPTAIMPPGNRSGRGALDHRLARGCAVAGPVTSACAAVRNRGAEPGKGAIPGRGSGRARARACATVAARSFAAPAGGRRDGCACSPGKYPCSTCPRSIGFTCLVLLVADRSQPGTVGWQRRDRRANFWRATEAAWLIALLRGGWLDRTSLISGAEQPPIGLRPVPAGR